MAQQTDLIQVNFHINLEDDSAVIKMICLNSSNNTHLCFAHFNIIHMFEIWARCNKIQRKTAEVMFPLIYTYFEEFENL